MLLRNISFQTTLTKKAFMCSRHKCQNVPSGLKDIALVTFKHSSCALLVVIINVTDWTQQFTALIMAVWAWNKAQMFTPELRRLGFEG